MNAYQRRPGMDVAHHQRDCRLDLASVSRYALESQNAKVSPTRRKVRLRFFLHVEIIVGHTLDYIEEATTLIGDWVIDDWRLRTCQRYDPVAPAIFHYQSHITQSPITKCHNGQ